MRKKAYMICFILILIVCAALVIGGCGVRQAMVPSGDDKNDAVEVSGGGENVVDAQDTDQEKKPADSEKPSDSSGSAGTDEKPAASAPDKNEGPSKGSDRSILGIPDAIDIRAEDDGNLLVIVNKYHAVSKDYKPKNLVTIDNRYGTWENMEMKDEAYKAYKKMYKDAADLGYNLKLCSAMRSYSTQKTLYENAVKNQGRKTANIRSAYPGRSEHHTGLAIDVTSASMGWGLRQDFADYPDGQWIDDHCHEYGFIIRYPKGKTDITGYDYEPWHLRYVGVDAATYIMENGLTLEEYVEQI